jgi:hypothetical protein
VHDALHLSHDDSSCLQICAPVTLRPALSDPGVNVGSTCYELGFNDFVRHDERAGVHYLRWER